MMHSLIDQGYAYFLKCRDQIDRDDTLFGIHPYKN